MIGALVLGGVAGVDRTAFGQTMLAHPVVCATLAGWYAGDPASGLRIGIVFGMFASRRAPLGGGGPVLDWTSASIAVPLALGPAAAGWQWGLGIVAGFCIALLGGHVIRALRAFAASREAGANARARSGDLGGIERLHMGMLVLHLLRGATVVALGSVAVSAVAFDLRWSGPEQSATTMIWAFAPVAAVTVLLQTQLRHAGVWPVVFGAAVSTLLVVAAGVLS